MYILFQHVLYVPRDERVKRLTISTDPFTHLLLF